MEVVLILSLFPYSVIFHTMSLLLLSLATPLHEPVLLGPEYFTILFMVHTSP